MLSRALQIREKVVPVTLKKTRLVAELEKCKRFEGGEAINSCRLLYVKQ